MANIIKPKRSNTAAAVPTTGQLASGEMAVNMADRKVYINNGTAVVQVGVGNLSGLGDTNISSPTNGQSLSYNSSTGKWVNSSAGTGTVTSVTATSPVASTGGTAPVISMPAATTSVSGYLTSTDWNTFNNKTSNTGTVTSVGGTGSYGGLTLSGTVTTSGNITLGGTPTGTWPISVSGASTSCSGNAATATTLQTARTIGGVSFNGSANINLPGVNTAGNQNTTGSSASCTGNAATATTASGVSAGVVAGKTIYDNFTATASQTTFTTSVTYTSGKIEVFANGVKMVNGEDVTVTSGTSVVFASGLAVSTKVTLVYPI